MKYLATLSKNNSMAAEKHLVKIFIKYAYDHVLYNVMT